MKINSRVHHHQGQQAQSLKRARASSPDVILPRKKLNDDMLAACRVLHNVLSRYPEHSAYISCRVLDYVSRAVGEIPNQHAMPLAALLTPCVMQRTKPALRRALLRRCTLCCWPSQSPLRRLAPREPPASSLRGPHHRRSKLRREAQARIDHRPQPYRCFTRLIEGFKRHIPKSRLPTR